MNGPSRRSSATSRTVSLAVSPPPTCGRVEATLHMGVKKGRAPGSPQGGRAALDPPSQTMNTVRPTTGTKQVLC